MRNRNPATAAATSAPKRSSIAVVAFNGVIPFHLSVPCMVFGEGIPTANPFDVVVCAGEPGCIRTSTGFGLSGLAPLEAARRADAIIVPGWRDALDPAPPALLRTLRAAHARGTQIVGLCLGTHVLAEAGLLDGRRATTHWEYAAAIGARFPTVEIDPNVLYVDDGRVLTSAGTAASLDACLYLLRQRLGATVANRAARRLVISPHREGGQAQFIEQPMPATVGDSRLVQLIERVRTRLAEAHTLDSLARAARMSRRSFTRHFRALTGTSVQAWLLAERLGYAQRLLESSDRSVERVAVIAGFGSAAGMRQHFRRVFGVSPATWRRNFRVPPREGSAITPAADAHPRARAVRGRAAAGYPPRRSARVSR
ncbi:MAG: GlxA family transcriptional regulator [Gammaproteobacteria bacterium]